MKKNLLFFCVLLYANFTTAQILPFKKSGAPQVLEQVVQGLSNDFSSMKGESVGSSPQSTDFKSSVCWTGAEICTITQYTGSDEKKPIVSNYSWQAIMPSKESFKEAVKQYKQIYSQINNSSVNFNGKKITLKAKYETPTEDIGFSATLFENTEGKRLQVEVQLTNTAMEWQVKIAVYEVAKKETTTNEY
jgi:hypothetical protein